MTIATLTLETLTIGMKAKRILSKRNINANIVKIDSSEHGSGCSYGIEFGEPYLYEVISILRENNISYGVYKRTKK